ncbi:MAG TPA: serine hydrolase domain-containing protein [Bryobacteraceae bacterium]|nr:serine hydrolase domain-containing protein [Bryobacteraceae bacterium]
MPKAIPALVLTTLAGAQSLPSDAEIRKLLAHRIDVQKKSLAMVAGIVAPEGTRIVSYGGVDSDTVFEIGSLTKVFTALLLADMAQRGELALTDPVAKYLPPGTRMPKPKGRAIELLDLATHTSGLPLWPPDFPTPLDFSAFSKYTEAQMYHFLATYELPRDTGSQWDYSNIGFALLGHALTRRAGMDYESLVHSRICAPLKLESTSIDLTPPIKRRLAVGHDAELKPSPEWSMPPFAVGAGSLHSTANDLLKLLAAFMDVEKSPLGSSMAAMFDTRRPGPQGMQQALGWWVVPLPGGAPIATHRGQSAGFFSNVAYDPATRTGVVVLSNSAADDGGIAWHLLRPKFPVQ